MSAAVMLDEIEAAARTLDTAREAYGAAMMRAFVQVENERYEATRKVAAMSHTIMLRDEEIATLTRERDEWRDKFLALNQTAGELCNACGWAFKIPGEQCRCEIVKERDEARADAERYLADLRRCASEPYERTRELEALQAEVERLRTEVASSLAMASAEADVLRGFGCMEDGDGPCGVCRECFYRHGYRRGAEAMREACAQWVDHWVSGHVADKLRDMPIPEEP